MRVAVIDFETTGADRQKDRPWGFGVIIVDENWDVEEGLSGRMWANDYPDISPEARAVCGIEDARLANVQHPSVALPAILALLVQADYVLAYNYEFDKTILEEECSRQGIAVPEFAWLCGLRDVNYEPRFRCRQLSHLAFDHGIVENGAHDALIDANLVAKLMKKRGETVEKIIAYRDDPWVYIKADLPKPWGKDEAKAKLLQAAAKADGYSWQTAKGTEGPVFEKCWIKRVKLAEFDTEKDKKLPFPRGEIKPQ